MRVVFVEQPGALPPAPEGRVAVLDVAFAGGEGFEKVTAGCPVPIVMAGGKKLPELDALEMAYRAVQDGAAGVDMGRNIFQSTDPAAMIRAVGAVVHESAKPQAAYSMFLRPPAEGT